jgi:hypothetical protein
MNKYLLMSAAAVMAATGGSTVAQAHAKTVHFTHSGVSYCDYFVITKGTGGLYAAVHHGGVSCATTSLQNDAGVDVKKTIQFADTTFAKAGIGYDGLDFDLTSNLGKGTWEIVASTNGTTAIILNSGGQKPMKTKPGAKETTLSRAIAELKISK